MDEIAFGQRLANVAPPKRGGGGQQNPGRGRKNLSKLMDKKCLIIVEKR